MYICIGICYRGLFWANINEDKIMQWVRKHLFDNNEQEPDKKSALPVLKPEKYMGKRPNTVTYLLPHTLQETQRQDFQHHLCRFLLQRHTLVPVTSSLRMILDVGCGAGAWMMEMAKTFPMAVIIGQDLKEPAVPQWSPSCKFVQGDILKGLQFPDQCMDFVHQRFMLLAIPTASWPHVGQEIIRVTRSGGWFELVENDIDIQREGPITHQLTEALFRVCQSHSIDPSSSTRLASFLPEDGIASIRQEEVPLPLGNWGGRIGQMALRNHIALLQSLKDLLLPKLGTTPDEFERLVMRMTQECESMQSFSFLRIVYGQRR
jgi:ubiquinone/menaquinone biosynthesis C-methylase UbiE